MKEKKFKLPKKVKAKWVAALRSGKYEQGAGYLKTGNTYCCLGVACVIGLANPIGSYGLGFGSYVTDEFLPSHIQKQLSAHNDGEGTPARSFKWIASYINRYL